MGAIAIVRKVDNPTPADFVTMPVADPPQKVYQPGSVESESRRGRPDERKRRTPTALRILLTG
jgi:hypothetical protein